MWPLAGFGPLGIAAAVIGTVGVAAYAAFNDNEHETGTYSNQDERTSELVKATKKERKKKIYQEIQVYKSKQKKRMKDKYNVDIQFYGGRSNVYQGIIKIGLSSFCGPIALAKELLDFDVSLSEKISINKSDEVDVIAALEKETEEMIKLIEKLEMKKHATAS